VGKLILLSVVIAMIAIPVLAARDRNPNRAFRRTVFFIFIFNAFYWLAVRFIYPRFL
jgi:hypothetical protein